MSCVKDPPAATATTTTTSRASLLSPPSAVNKQPHSLMSSTHSPGRAGDLSPILRGHTGLCTSPQTWGEVWSVWSTTVVPGKDLNRFITKSSCGPVRAAASVSPCKRKKGGASEGGGEREREGERERGGEKFPFFLR